MRLSVSDLLEILSNAYFSDDVRTRAHTALASRLEALDAECPLGPQPPIPPAAGMEMPAPTPSIDSVLSAPWGMRRGLVLIDTHAGPLD